MAYDRKVAIKSESYSGWLSPKLPMQHPQVAVPKDLTWDLLSPQ